MFYHLQTLILFTILSSTKIILKITCTQPEWDEITVDEMSVDEMVADKMSCYQNSVHRYCTQWPNGQGS